MKEIQYLRRRSNVTIQPKFPFPVCVSCEYLRARTPLSRRIPARPRASGTSVEGELCAITCPPRISETRPDTALPCLSYCPFGDVAQTCAAVAFRKYYASSILFSAVRAEGFRFSSESVATRFLHELPYEKLFIIDQVLD